MPIFRRKPTKITAEQFFYDGPSVPGVFYPSKEGGTYVGDAFVVTAHEQRVYLQNSDWIVGEPDGVHFYPIKDEIFRNLYEPANADEASELIDTAAK